MEDLFYQWSKWRSCFIGGVRGGVVLLVEYVEELFYWWSKWRSCFTGVSGWFIDIHQYI